MIFYWCISSLSIENYFIFLSLFENTVKPVLSGHSKRRQKLVFKTDYRLMQVKSIGKGSILQYFRPSLSYYLSLRSLFCLFWNGRLRQVLLYAVFDLTKAQTLIGTAYTGECRSVMVECMGGSRGGGGGGGGGAGGPDPLLKITKI